MPYLVIPNEVFANDAIIWVAAINENFDSAAAVLEYGPNQVALNAGWSNFATADGNFNIRYQRVQLHNLTQQSTYPLTFSVAGEWKADASIKTIPWRLPSRAESPFIAMLGSCFYAREDPDGTVGRTYMNLPADAQPDIKILCGDQVYLDNPPQDFLNPLRSRNWLEHRSFKTYVDAWTQQTQGDGGFGQLLKHGANFFSSDDHEFWNNAPDVGLNVPFFTLREKGRKEWWDIASNLFQIFQTVPSAPIRFNIDPLSFCICETRFNRGHGGGDGDFMSPANLQAIGQWTAGLNGPGVLVVGQPFFAVAGSIKDYGLPDFHRQYEELKGYLRQSQHSIVILTGDVHFGRIAVCKLRPELGTELWEVISSPMQLVPHGGGPYAKAPQVFGEVTSKTDFSQGHNHFLTLEFKALGGQSISMLPRYWPIAKAGMPVQSASIVDKAIELF
jgi:hypothetical protein